MSARLSRAYCVALIRITPLRPVAWLCQVAQEALNLTDMICRAALEQGDAEGFCRYLGAAVALRDFTVDAGLLPWCPSQR